MSEETNNVAVFSCEYSEQNPVYCQQCGGHEHLCRKRLNTEGLTAYFEQMATDGRVETTVQWLVEISLLIQSEVEKRLKHETLSLFQWKNVVAGLPEVSGVYLVAVKDRGLRCAGLNADSSSEQELWKQQYDAYIPYPIPIYEEGAQ